MKNKKSPLKVVGAAMGVGVNSQPANIIDATSHFDPNAQAAMQGIYGDITGRQTSLGASGIYALNKHLSPLKNENELSAYKGVDEEDIPGYDDGAGGIDYEINKETPGYSDEEAEKEFNRMKYITDASIKKGAGAVITVPKNKN
tara:strand:+ start:84 stop:515 length:432 start_codon:yes stop_codon:yes gene_type:complete